jgi:hypothetical protein
MIKIQPGFTIENKTDEGRGLLLCFTNGLFSFGEIRTFKKINHGTYIRFKYD